MDLNDYLAVFRRRWTLIAVTVVLGLVAGWVTLPDSGGTRTRPAAKSYTSTATLITDATTETPMNLASVALYATVGEIPDDAAQRLGYDGQPQVLAALVTVVPNVETGTLSITSADPAGRTAAARVNAFAAATIKYFEDQEQQTAREQVRGLQLQIDRLDQQILEQQYQQVANPDDPLVQARLGSLTEQYQLALSQAAALRPDVQSAGPLEVLQRGVAIPVAAARVPFAPTNPWARVGLVGALALLLALALALLVERIDSRLRDRNQAEKSFGLPVLAEIPKLPWVKRRRATLLSVEQPAGATAEAFRTLRSAVLLLRPSTNHVAAKQGGKEPRIALITSPGAREGKTTTVANLAIALAETGRRVLVLSFDFRNPRLHDYLQVSNDRGLSEVLAEGEPRALTQVIQDTPYRDVRIATSGHAAENPGALLGGAGALIAQARRLADVVLLDTAPLLVASDAVDLAQHADTVLVVGRLNRTSKHTAGAAQRVLSRLGVPALGVVLLGTSTHSPVEGYLLPFPKADKHGERIASARTRNASDGPEAHRDA